MLAPSLHPDFYARCRAIIAHFLSGSEQATIVPLTCSQGFSGALVTRVELGPRAFALRRWPSPGTDATRISGLHRLLEHTAHAGLYQIAVPLRAAGNASLILCDGNWWQLEPWMPGRADFHTHPSRQRLRHAMETLARWHRAAETWMPQAGDERWFYTAAAMPSPGIHERLQTLQDWQTGGLQRVKTGTQLLAEQEFTDDLREIWNSFASLSADVQKKLIAVREIRMPVQPCLRDIWHDHLLFTGNELTGLIDPAACRTDNVATDLARLLGSLLEDDRAGWTVALDNYQTIRPLGLDELRLLDAFDASSVLLSGITWLNWLLIEKRQFPDAARVSDRLKLVLRRMDSLRRRQGGQIVY